MAELSLAETLLAQARRDEQAFRKLASDPALHDSLAGFHAKTGTMQNRVQNRGRITVSRFA